MKVTKISNAVLDILGECRAIENRLQITAQLDRKVYAEVNKIIEAAGGKWDKKAKAHIFAGDAAEALEPIILTGEIIKPSDMGQFDTPMALAREIVGMVDLTNIDLILEPSAGIGNMVQVIRETVPGAHVFACEIDPARAAILKRNFDVRVKTGDFLQLDPAKYKFDAIIMNPPFARQADIDHVLHAYRMLRPKGTLVSIMSAGVTFRTNRKTEEFKKFFGDRMTIDELPTGSFKASGTPVNTVVVKIEGGQ